LTGTDRHAVLVSPDLSNAAGGVERMCVLLAGVLERDGWRTTIVGPQHDVTRWQFRLALGPVMRSRSAARAVRAQDADLLITNGYMGAGYASRAHGGYAGGTHAGSTSRAHAGHASGARGPVTRIHVYHGTSVGAVRAVGANVARRERVRHMIGHAAAETLSARGATAVVCVSDSAAREARRFYRVGDTTVIANGIDTDVFSPRPRDHARRQLGLASDGRYALFVGRLDDGKGARLLPTACASAGYELLVAGRDTDAEAINLGILAPAELAIAYAAADCVLFPSLYEACSYVVLEALACGVPLITTRVGWMPTLLAAVPAYEALCVEPVLEQLIARLRGLDRLDTERLSAAARAFVVEHNSLGAYAARWRELLDRHVG
jgi:glycosyltransferase involved in cell wall biosynthesis